MIDTKQATLQQCNVVKQSEYLNAPIEQDFTHVLARRHPYKYAQKVTYWYNPTDGQVIGPDGTKVNIPASTSLTTLLEKIKISTARKGKKKAILYLVAGKATTKNRPKQEWFDVHSGWTKVKTIDQRRLIVDYKHNDFDVSLYGTCNFFGNETDLDAMYKTWQTFEPKLAHTFGVEEGYKLLGDTPAQTGRELIEISLPKEKWYPHLAGKPAEIVYHNLRYQGRVETFSQKREVLENGLYVLDARFMYASCLSHLPVGPVYHDKVNEFLGVRTQAGTWYPSCPGFYNVTTCPTTMWNHIGLIKSGKSKSPVDDRGYYPNTPGEIITNWTTAAEVVLLLNNGWPVHINERIFWPDTEKTTDPLAIWLRNLKEMRAAIEQELEVHTDDKILTLQKGMIRDIVIAATGSFHQYMTYESHFTPRSELPLKVTPYKSHRTLKGVEWIEAIPLSEHRQKWIHPEWSATAWGRARARLATFALQLPYEDVVVILNDCTWCASKPEWLDNEDTGKPGSFREKGHVEKPVYWPKDMSEVNTYIAKYHLGGTTNDDFNEQEKEQQ